jgi:hypothetical protein
MRGFGVALLPPPKPSPKDGPIIVITEARIKAAGRAAGGKPRTELHDRGARGAGRLILVVRSKGASAAPSAEFFACWYSDGKRLLSKLGSHRAQALPPRRGTISAGGEPTIAAARRRHRTNARTVGELFGADVASLKAAGKRSADLVERFLDAAAAAIGSSRPAGEITPGDIVPHLSGIHDRGAKVHAVMVRAYLSAGFAVA